MDKVQIYTDGACSGNPGPGGYGTILSIGEIEKELSGGYTLTTNNRMELMAAIAGLEALKRPCLVELYSDSKYLVDAIEKGWLKSWKAAGWKRKSGKVVNPDLWQRLDKLLAVHTVKFNWVRGHVGNAKNERCDTLAVSAIKADDLPIDEGYSPE